MPRRMRAEEVDALFTRQRAGDPVGLGIHLLLAAGACFMAGWSTTFVDWAALGVLVCFFVRMTGWHSVLEPLAFDRVLRLLLAWGAWVGVSVAWSAGREGGSREWVNDIQTLRFLPLGILMWPVMDRRGWLIAAVMAGIACGQMSQMVHLVGGMMHAAWVPWHRADGRITGWWDPAVCGSILCAGLGLWLAPALFGRRGEVRLVGAIGACATIACIGLSGTRGAWIGAAMLMVIAGGIAGWRVRPRSRVVVPMVVAGVLCVVGAGIAYFAAGPQIRDRLDRGVAEVRGVFESDDYSTDTGMRIAMWKWAVMEFRAHPVVGVGAGGFRPAAAEMWQDMPKPAETRTHVLSVEQRRGYLPMPHAHAHSWALHTAATLGSVGVVLLAWLVWSAVRGGLKESAQVAGEATANLWHDLVRSLAWGPSLALIGLVCAGLFDSITINQQTSYLFYLLVGLCFATRPREAGLLRAEGAAP